MVRPLPWPGCCGVGCLPCWACWKVSERFLKARRPARLMTTAPRTIPPASSPATASTPAASATTVSSQISRISQAATARGRKVRAGERRRGAVEVGTPVVIPTSVPGAE